MSHETHHNSDNRPTKTPFISSFWFVVILVGLFIAAVNFVNVMGHEETRHGKSGHESPEVHYPTHEATSNQTSEGETGTDVSTTDTTQHQGNSAETNHAEGH